MAKDEWVEHQRQAALTGLGRIAASAHTETTFTPVSQNPSLSHFQLLDAARIAPIHTFGWPIGVFLERDEYRPRPRRDGITAEVLWEERLTYDFWSLSLNGDFFLLKTMSEDALGHPEAIFFDTRIIRTCERLLYCRRLYKALGFPDDAVIDVRIAYVGLISRVLKSAGRRLVTPKKSDEDIADHLERILLSDIDDNLVGLVQKFCEPLFVLFDFFRVDESIYTELVDAFSAGEVK